MAVTGNGSSRESRLIPESEFLKRGLRIIREEQLKEQRRRLNRTVDRWTVRPGERNT